MPHSDFAFFIVNVTQLPLYKFPQEEQNRNRQSNIFNKKSPQIILQNKKHDLLV